MSHASTLLSLLQHVVRAADSARSADQALRSGAALVCAATGLRGGEPVATRPGGTASRAAATGAPAVDDGPAPADGLLVAVPVMVRGNAALVLGFRADRRPNLMTLATLGAVGSALGRAVERERAAGIQAA